MILHNSSHSWSSKGEIAAHKFALEQTITGTFKKHNNPTTSTNKATKKNPGKKPQQKDHTHRLLRLYNSKRKKKTILLRICITSLPCMLWHSTNMAPGKTT